MWGFPMLSIQQVGMEVLTLFYIRLCRAKVRALDNKLRGETLTPKDRERLKARLWKIIGYSVDLNQSRNNSQAQELV